MSSVLEGLNGVVNMIDDIFIFGNTQEKHDRRLRQVLQRDAIAVVKVSNKKRAFSVSEVKFLGAIVSTEDVSEDPGKIQALTSLMPPSDVSEVGRLLRWLTT